MILDITTINEIAVQYGIFAGLFVALLIYVIKNNDKREKAYQDTISSLNCKILEETKVNSTGINTLSDDVDELDKKLSCISTKVDSVDTKVDGMDKKVETIQLKVDSIVSKF